MPKYNIEYSKSVLKFLWKHPEISRMFYEKISLMKTNPRHPLLDIKRLTGLPSYRLRIGKYRFLFTLEEERIFIYFYQADSRGDIY